MKYRTTRRFSLLSIMMLVSMYLSACGTAAAPTADAMDDPANEVPTHENHANFPSEENAGFDTAPEDLPPCGIFETLRILEAPEPVPPEPANTPNPSAPTPRPAPKEDRVGFPENFATEFKLLVLFDRPDRRAVRIICGNDIAASHKEGEPFAYGSVLFMATYSAKLDSNGQPILDENGHYIREKLVQYNVMRKEEGFGTEYGEDRAGEWEFVAYKEDGSYETPPEKSNNCAVCHGGQGGESIDYVFRMDMVEAGESALTMPAAGENEISIYLYSFQEPQLKIKKGTTVTWINNDQADHTIMAAHMDNEGHVIPDSDPLFSSDILPSVTIRSGASFSFTFDEAGEYWYLCTVHKNMYGQIIVTE